LNNQTEEITEIFVTPSKHFKVWLNDVESFCLVMESHKLPERTEMEFIDQYPRTTTRLSHDRGVVVDREILWKDISDLVNGDARVQ